MDILVQTPQSKRAVLNATINILIVDDRPENLLTIETIIESEHRHIFKAESGNDALKIAMRENIGLVLLDIQMPEMDGIEVAQLLRSNPKTKHIPIIFVSAIAKSEKPSLKIFEEGSVDFLFKPLELEDTRSRVAIFEKMYWNGLKQVKLQEQLVIERKEVEKTLALITNDFKLPVKAVENLTQWIEEDTCGIDNPNFSENLSLLKNRSKRLQDLIEGLSEYVSALRISEPKEPVDCNNIVKQVIEMVKAPAPFTISCSELPVIATEKNKLTKLFYELIKNAVVHHNNPLKGMITISYSTGKSGEHQFSISDNGPGIKQQHHQSIFELFQSAIPNESLNTSGVGLAIAKKLVQQNGGTIWLTANTPCGSCFHFTWKE